ncbi:probable serine/threonine-protein kinase PBL7 [Vigna umbellata]|uniref:probable serine/threonine-protein kinase PBL7 n=1 Tax=Vigna umbellata TaxID=87088 RepID=UPI001F5ED766|nr:probable serine/threonine-protein kinase PBL7 [Vigna umbellata]
MLSLLYHPNLVTLIGYCCERDQRLLVYEYMPLGSLENHLFDRRLGREPLDWNTRMKIASGVAKGLEYLEIWRDLPVMFGELRSSNILLDEGYHPKLSYFGIPKFGPLGNSSHVSTGSVGKYGYCAPEYAVTGNLTPECKVYGLGVVLLELISGRKAIDKSRSPETCHLVKWAQPILKDISEYHRLVDPLLHGSYQVEWLNQAIVIAAMCLHEKADRRPTIREVVSALTYIESQQKQCNRRGRHLCSFFYPSLVRKESGLEKERKKGEFERGSTGYGADSGKQVVGYIDMLEI